MEINSSSAQPPQQVQPQAQAEQATKATTQDAQRSDTPNPGSEPRVEVSDKARQMAQVRKAVDDAPDVRDDKVKELAEQISAGTYNVDGRVVAQAVVRQAAFEAVA